MNLPTFNLAFAYAIKSHATGNQGQALLLSVTDGKEVVVRYQSNPAHPELEDLWLPLTWIGHDNQTNRASLLYHIATDHVIVAPEDNAKVSLLPFSEIEEEKAVFWNIYGDINNFGALQLGRNTSQNLNISGDGPTYPDNNEVIVYHWNDGAANEIWQFEKITRAMMIQRG